MAQSGEAVVPVVSGWCAKISAASGSVRIIFRLFSRGLISGFRTVAGWWRQSVCGELGGGVFGFPSLSFGDGVEQQDGSWWDVGVGGAGSFPEVRAVLRAVGRLDANGFEELPDKVGPFGAVVIQCAERANM
jgi:hypothetical protein